MDAPGKPPVWCETRQELCEGLPYFRSFQSGLYKQDGLAKGYLIDGKGADNYHLCIFAKPFNHNDVVNFLTGFCAERDVWNGKVFISHGGGSHAAPKTGTGLKATTSTSRVAKRAALPLGASQKESHASIQTLISTMKAGAPFAVIIGSHYGLAEFKIPHRYCVAGYYIITDYWNEKEYVEGSRELFHVRWKFRFEWAKGNPEEPWFRTLETEEDTSAPSPFLCDECSSCALLREDSRIVSYEEVIENNPLLNGLRRVTYVLPTGGRIEHIRARPGHALAEEGEAIFRQYQHEVELQRFRHTSHRVKGFVTQNYCHNAGRAYTHSVKLPATAFEHDPPVIQRARDILQEISPDSEVNELLSLFYLKGQKIAFHDDGESEVQGPIIGWSLGSDSIMRFREKLPTQVSNKRKSAKAAPCAKRKRDEHCVCSPGASEIVAPDCSGEDSNVKRQRARAQLEADPFHIRLPASAMKHKHPADVTVPAPTIAYNTSAAPDDRPTVYSEEAKVREPLETDASKSESLEADIRKAKIMALATRICETHNGKSGVSSTFLTETKPVLPSAESISSSCTTLNGRNEDLLEDRNIGQFLEAGIRKSKIMALAMRICESKLPRKRRRNRRKFKERLKNHIAKQPAQNKPPTVPVQATEALLGPKKDCPMSLESILNPVNPGDGAPISPPATPAMPVTLPLTVTPVTPVTPVPPVIPIPPVTPVPPVTPASPITPAPFTPDQQSTDSAMTPENPNSNHELDARGKSKTTRHTVLELLTRHGDVVIMIGPSVQRHYEHAAQPTGLRLCITGRTLSALGERSTYADPPWTPPPGSMRLPAFYKRKATAVSTASTIH
ncbi:hypothetical protein HDU86_000737 [Geranomyces michiganensis]|nr:hypothetical protein HDU86_000737 [Geranomyces michiganensis]